MKVSCIELAGRKYPMCLSLTAAAALEDTFGDLTKMGETLTQGSIRDKTAAVNDVLRILMEAGRACVLAEGGEVPEPLNCAPSDVLDIASGAAVKAIFSAISSDTRREVETEPKKAEAAPAGP